MSSAVNYTIDWDNYENKVFHKLIHHHHGRWEWLPFSYSTHSGICDKIKSKDYYVKPEELHTFMKNNIDGLSNITRYGDSVSLSDIFFIRNANGYFLAMFGHYRPINLKDFKYKIE